MRLFKFLIIMMAILFATTANAHQTGFYIGGAFGNTVFEDDNRYRDLGLNLDDDDRGGQLFVGFDVNRYFGVEATLADLGEFTDSKQTFTDEFAVMAITAVGKIPIANGPVSFYGKAGFGVIYWEEEDTFFGTTRDDSIGTVAIGFGVAFTPGSEHYLTFRLGWDFYAFILEEDYPPYRDYDQALGMGSLGLQLNF
jgi:OOP family OmpA-OmpF porin